VIPVVLGYIGQVSSYSLGIILVGGIVIAGASATLGLRLLTELEEGC
jgi:hypothetical protein